MPPTLGAMETVLAGGTQAGTRGRVTSGTGTTTTPVAALRAPVAFRTRARAEGAVPAYIETAGDGGKSIRGNHVRELSFN